MKPIQKFLQNEDGVTAIEYGLIAAAIALVIALLSTPLSDAIKAVFNKFIVAMGGTAV